MNIEERIEYLRRKGEAKKASSHWYKKWWGILLLLLLSAILVYGLSFSFLIFRLIKNPLELKTFLNSRGNNTESTTETDNSEANTKLIEGLGTNFLGAQTATFTLVVFSDFSCPYCKEASKTIAALAVKYNNSLKIIVRDYPILSEDSVDLAMVARCAGDQDKYWPMYYKLFELQKTFKDVGIASIIQTIGITDTEKFYNCIDEKKYLNDISKDASDGQFLKITGTPTWFLNGVKVGEGNIPLSVWTDFFDKFLKENK